MNTVFFTIRNMIVLLAVPFFGAIACKLGVGIPFFPVLLLLLVITATSIHLGTGNIFRYVEWCALGLSAIYLGFLVVTWCIAPELVPYISSFNKGNIAMFGDKLQSTHKVNWQIVMDGIEKKNRETIQPALKILRAEGKLLEAAKIESAWVAEQKQIRNEYFKTEEKSETKQKASKTKTDGRAPLSTGQIVIPPKGESQEYYTELGYAARWSNDSDFKIRYENGVEVGPSEHTNLSLPYRFINRSDKEIIIRTNVSKA